MLEISCETPVGGGGEVKDQPAAHPVAMRALVLAFLVLALPSVSSPAHAGYCAYVSPDVPPDVQLEECNQATSADGRAVFYLNGECVRLEPVGTIPPVEVYDCDTGASLVP